MIRSKGLKFKPTLLHCAGAIATGILDIASYYMHVKVLFDLYEINKSLIVDLLDMK